MPKTTTITICEELEQLIVHPAEYLQEKVRREGISCLFLPHCCTPAWPTFPECYVMQWVKKRDAWQEIRKTYTCEHFELELEDAFDRWLRNTLNPVPGFRILTGDLTELFGTYISAAYEVADPVPDQYRDQLLAMADRSIFRFSRQNVRDARWLKSDHALARRIWPGGNVQGITYYNLIIVSGAFFNPSGCVAQSLWAHELVHVHQYNQMGWENFIQDYLSQGMVKSWQDITLEAEAIEVEALAVGDCAELQPLNPMMQSFLEVHRSIIAALRRLESSGDAEIKSGALVRVSERGEKLLRRIAPHINTSSEAIVQAPGPSERLPAELSDRLPRIADADIVHRVTEEEPHGHEATDDRSASRRPDSV